MKIKKSIMAVIMALLLVLMSACEPPDPEDIATVIEQASAIAYNEVVHKNPDMEQPLKEIAVLSLDILEGGSIDVVKAKSMLYSALDCFNCLDDDDKRIIVDMFSIIVPLINLPKEGIVEDDQLLFMKAFFRGILNAVELKEELETDEEVRNRLATLLD